MSDFLPTDYEVPQKSGNYMKFEDGENKFRILASPVMGWEYWKTGKDAKRTPIRKHMDESIEAVDLEEGENPKHFWAMPVWNYKEERVQILEVTQKGILKTIRALSVSKEWGTPLGYDLLVIKSGQKLETEYVVQPAPPKKFDEAYAEVYKNMDINLEALFTGEDPFKSELSDKDIDDIGKEVKDS